jgi:hypothetical protein
MVASGLEHARAPARAIYKYKYSSLVTAMGEDIQGKGVGEIVENQCLKTLKRLQKQVGRDPEIYTGCEAMSIPVI